MKKYTKHIVASLVVVALVITIAITSANKVPQKEGSPLVYESSYGAISQKEYFEMLNTPQSDILVYAKFETDLLTAIEKDETIIENAKKQAMLMLENTPDDQLSGMEAELKQMGYDGMDELHVYFENMMYRDRVASEYVIDNMEAVYPAYAELNRPRTVSHILIKVEDVNAPTAEEQANLDAIRKRVVDGEDFATVAKEVSVDTSKEDGGALGLMDKNTPFVQPFLVAALSQEKGQIGEWVKSDFGYHLILVNETDADKLQEMSELPSMIVQGTPAISVTVMKKIMIDANVEFIDKDFEARISAIIESVA